MAFTTKQFNDLRGFLFLMLLTIPSIATTNIDCNGKPFHCMNSTHFMICVDLGSGVSSTIDSFIIPCPAPTECHSTNRFECEFPAVTTQPPTNELLEIITDQTTIATVQASDSTAQFVPDIITTIPLEDLFNTVSTTTLSRSELSTPNPTFTTDSITIDVFDNANVSTSGSHAGLGVDGKLNDVLNVTSSTQDVISETIVSSVITDSAVANTTENAMTFTQTDSYLDTINKITTVNLDVGITTTEQDKIATFTTTETVSLITENVTETNNNSISEKQLVTGNINSLNSIQNLAEYTTESIGSDTQVDNNAASTIEIILDHSIIANDKDQLRTDKPNETKVPVKNSLENVVINAENTVTTSTDVPNDYTVTDGLTKETIPIYATTKTLVASSINIPSDLSLTTESIIIVEPNILIENKVIADQEKQFLTVNRETIEKTLRPIPKTNIEVSTQNATSNNNLLNEGIASNNDSHIITGPSSELHNAVISSTVPTFETTLNMETMITQDAFYSIKNTNAISTSEVNVTPDTAIGNVNNNNIVDNISTISQPSTDSPTLTTDDKIVSIKSTNPDTIQNEIVVSSLGTFSKNLLTLVTTEKKLEFNPTETDPAVSESNINFVSNVLDSQPSKLDPVSQQLEVSNKLDKDTTVSNINSQLDIPSNIDLNADNQENKTKMIITEPTFTETEKSIDNINVHTRIQLVEHNYITPQRENLTPTIKTTQTTKSSNDIASDSNVIFEPSITSLPVLPTESFLYLEAHTLEKANKDQVVIESMAADDNKLNSQNNKEIDLISSILPTKAIGQYFDGTESNRKADKLYTTSETNNITDTLNQRAFDNNMDKITITELRKTRDEPTSVPTIPKDEQTKTQLQETAEINSLQKISTDTAIFYSPTKAADRHELPTMPKNEQTKTQLQETVEINTLQKTSTDTAILYSPTIAADGKLISIESTIFENDQNKIKATVVDTTSSENILNLATTDSILELNPTATDSTVSESNLFLDSSVNVQLPKALVTKAVEIINKHNLNVPEVGSEKLNRVEPKGYETPMASMIEIQSQLREIEFNTQQHKLPKTISSITRSIAENDYISKLPVTESTRNGNFDVLSKTASPHSILQITSSMFENIEKNNFASKVVNHMDSTTKNNIENSPNFIRIKDDNPKYRGTGDLTTTSIPTISISGNYDKEVQDHTLQKMVSPQNQIPIVNSVENLQYNTNIKLSEGLTTLQKTHIEQMTTESKFASQSYIENVNENSQDKTSNNTNTVVNAAVNSVPMPINSNKLSLKTENVSKFNNQETKVPILEKAGIHLTSSSNAVIPDEFHVVTDNTAYSKINHEVQPDALSKSINNNKVDVIIGTTNNVPNLPQLSSVGDFNIQNTYIDKNIIIKQDSLGTKESVPKESINAAVNEGERTRADIINNTSTNYSDTKGQIIPAESGTGSNVNNNSFSQLHYKTSIENSPNLIKFNESTVTLVSKNMDQNFTIENDTKLSEVETVQTRNNQEGFSIDGLVQIVPTQTSDLLKIVPIKTDKTSTPVTNIHNSEKYQPLNYNLIKFNESTLTLVGKKMDHNFTIENDTKLSQVETVQTRNKLEGLSIDGLVKTVPTQTSDLLKIVPNKVDKTSTPVTNIHNSEKDRPLNYEAVIKTTPSLKSLQIFGGDNTATKVSGTEKKNATEHIHSSFLSSKDGYQNGNKVPEAKMKSFAERDVLTTSNKLSITQFESTSRNSQKLNNNAGENGKKVSEARIKSFAERDVSTTPNKLSITQVELTSRNSQKLNNNAGEAVNLAPFDSLSRGKSNGFEENNNKPSTEKPDDEETTASSSGAENSKINKDSSFTTLSSENVSVTSEPVEGDNNGSYNNNIVRSNIETLTSNPTIKKDSSFTTLSSENVSVTSEPVEGDNNGSYNNNIIRSNIETLTSKPTIKISTRPTQVDNLKNIQSPIISEVSTQSTVRSTSQKLSLENNTPLPATTKAVTNGFVCKFNQRGRFADNHDCRKFYICHGRPQPLEGICPVNTVFSELRKQCTKNLSHCVRNNQFQCMSEGHFSDFLNDNIYYICVKNKLSNFIRFKLRCQNGYHLNKTSVRCVLNMESSQSISSDISKSISEKSAALKVEVISKDSKSKDSSKKKFECKKEGTFAKPDNCRVYYVCKKTSKSGYLRKKKKCDSDEYFHKDKKKCVDAESYECK